MAPPEQRRICLTDVEIDRFEAVGTIETEFELHLDQFPARHRRVFAWEARPGNEQVRPDGTAAGEVTVAQLLYGSHRYNLSRVIVGEVRGGEVTTMFEAMQAGAGSMSTIHADDAKAVVERLVTLAIDGSTGGPEYAYRQVAQHIDVIVHIAVRDTSGPDGTRRRRRFVSEVVAVDLGEEGRPALTDVFTHSDGAPDLLAPIISQWNAGDHADARQNFTRLLPLILFGLQQGIAWAWSPAGSSTTPLSGLLHAHLIRPAGPRSIRSCATSP